MTDNPKLSLQKIKMTNYRSYCDNNEMIFSNDSKRTITVIHGDMGRGKTTIMDAIYWCLYNSEPEKPQKKDQSDESVINSNAYKVLEIGESGKTQVEVTFSDDVGPYLIITRTVEFTKNSNDADLKTITNLSGKIPKGLSIVEKVSMVERKLDSSSLQFKPAVENTQKVSEKIEEFFPRSLAMFFLFDAELLHNFFGPKNNYVKQGIEDITGLPILKTMEKNFLKVKDLQKEASSIDPILTTKKEQVDIYKSKMTQLISNKINLQKQIDDVQNQIDGIDVELDTIGGEKYLELKTAEKDLDFAIGKTNDEITNLDNRIKTDIRNALPVLLLRNTLEDVEEKFDIDEREGKIPTPLTPTALRKIIEDKTCICEEPLKENILEKFQKQLDLSGNSPLIQNISAGRHQISNLLTNFMPEKIESGIDQLRKLRLDFREELTGSKRAKKTISDQIDGIPADRVSKLKNSRKNLVDNTLAELQRDIGAIEGELVKAKENFDDAEKDYQEHLKKRDELKTSYRKQLIAQFCARESNRLRDELIQELRLDAEEHTTKFFLEMVNKDDFANVEISKNYTTRALGHDGVAQGISSGQSVAMALSFIAAMREITGQKYFLFIDSGYHNMSAPERLELARGFSNFLKGTQITLLVQGQEYDNESKKDLGSEIITSVRKELQNLNLLYREYLLKKIPKTKEGLKSCTKVELHKDYMDD